MHHLMMQLKIEASVVVVLRCLLMAMGLAQPIEMINSSTGRVLNYYWLCL
jgi:hypothetical protein